MKMAEPSETVDEQDARIFGRLLASKAINAAFNAQVELLFRNFCDGMSEKDYSNRTQAMERFSAGFEIANRARSYALRTHACP